MKILGKRTTALFLVLLMLCLNIPVAAAEGSTDGNPLHQSLPTIEAGQSYLVHYTDADPAAPASAAWDSLSGEELQEALSEGQVDYYEVDADVPLIDAGWGRQTDEEPSAELAEVYEKWENTLVGVQAMTELEAFGTGIVIGVIDSGISAHDEFADRLLSGYNYLDENTDTTDTYGHGTKVAGMIAAEMDGEGISGIAPEALLVPLKCFDEKSTKVSNLVQAIYDAVDVYGCDIINMSFGTSKASTAMEAAVNYAAEQGAVMVAAVGNNASEVLMYPAAFEPVIGVTSVTASSSHVSSAQINDSVCISAPGSLITTTAADGGYVTTSGTSFATPIVAGAVADLLSIDPTLTAEQIRALLTENATDLGESGYDTTYGYGLLNLEACRAALLGTAELYLTQPVVTEETLSLKALRLSGTGSSLLLVTTVTEAETGKLLGAAAQSVALDEAGSAEAVLELPTRIADETLLPENLLPEYQRTVTLEDGRVVTVYAVWPGRCFVDVAYGHYYFQPVLWAAAQGITKGTSEWNFSPEQECTRAQVVTFLWRAAGSPEPEGDGNTFVDLRQGAFYTKAVQWAVEQGITAGVDDTHFDPEGTCTRAQVVTFLWRAAGSLEPEGDGNTFVDLRQGAFYTKAVQWAVEQGITDGVDKTHFAPGGVCTRGQVVTFLYRAYSDAYAG